MKNGLMTIEKTDEQTQAVFIDQDVLECARLNVRTKERINNLKKAQSQKAKEKKRIERMKNRIWAELVTSGLVAICGMVGWIHTLLWVPTSIVLLCAACVGLGACLGVKK